MLVLFFFWAETYFGINTELVHIFIERFTDSGGGDLRKNTIGSLLGGNLKKIYEKAMLDESCIQELRLRIYSPFLLIYKGKEWILDRDGRRAVSVETGYVVQPEDIKETLSYVAVYSFYAYEEELSQGYLTVEGGHRVGVAGKVITQGTNVKGMKYISYINIRVAHQIKGCASHIFPYLVDLNQVLHTLIISAPCCGKTTILRDLIRLFSAGTDHFPGCSVGVVDERSEIGGSYMGIPQNDLGPRTDLLDSCPKAEGMMMLIRSMAPAVLAVDELGSYDDIHAIESVIHCGCKLLATVHGNSLEDVRKKPLFERLMCERVFQRYIVLSGRERIGRMKMILDQDGKILWKEQDL